MSPGFQGRVLKSGYARTVYVDEEGRVVKRFHHPNPLQALRDRRRAAGERRALAALAAASLPVPRPFGVRRVRHVAGAPLGAWELVMERIDGAVELADILDGRARSPLAPEDLARRIGVLLAEGQAAGLDHPDLHPGNWLVDGTGRVWLIDFHKARVRAARRGSRARADARLAERDLFALIAYLRESLSVAARAALIRGWAETASGSHARRIGELTHQVEETARLHRRAWVAHAEGRWSRESSRCIAHPGEGPRGMSAFVRRDAPEGLARALRRLVSARDEPSPAARVSIGADEVLLLNGAEAATARAWATAVRCFEHRLPALQPAALCGGRAAFLVPRGAAPGVTLSPESAGAVLGAVHDRGLDVRTLADAWASDQGAHLSPLTELGQIDPRPGRVEVPERFAACAPYADDAAFRRAYVDAFRGHADERDALARELLPDD